MENLSNQSELPRETTATDGAVAHDEPALEPPPADLSPQPDGRDDPSEIPVAAIHAPVALLLPETPDHAVLENRLQRLEAELAHLRNTTATATHFTNQPAPSVAHEPGGLWGRWFGPSAAKTTRGVSGPPSLVPNSVRHTWLLFDALAELRAIYWMFFDPRYRLSLTARLAPLVFLTLILTSYYWTPGTILPFYIGYVIEKLCDLILAYFLFKLLSHEARRYRETAPDLPPSLRL